MPRQLDCLKTSSARPPIGRAGNPIRLLDIDHARLNNRISLNPEGRLWPSHKLQKNLRLLCNCSQVITGGAPVVNQLINLFVTDRTKDQSSRQ